MNALAHKGLVSNDSRELEREAYSFAYAALREQNVSSLAARSAARALALLLARSLERPNDPVVLSALEGAQACHFEPRTWWHVKRRLLELGHLVASTGGGPPSGRPGGRGHKAGYFVAAATRERFSAFLARERSLNPLEETVKGSRQTLKSSGEERKVSHHRFLRILEKERTSDVLSRETHDKPSPEAIWALVKSERNSRVKLRLLRLLETALLSEVLERAMVCRAPQTENAAPQTQTVKDSPAPPREPRGRRVRAEQPLWSPSSPEEQAVFDRVREILSWSNQAFGARFDLERSSRDTLLYPFERVRGAVANVLLKKARSYRFVNPGAVLWDGITLEGYKLEEFSAGPFFEVLERLGKGLPALPSPTTVPADQTCVSPSPFESERKERLLLQAVYEKLPADVRADLDERALSLAHKDLRGANPLRLGLLRLDKRNELLVAEHGDVLNREAAMEESQIPVIASVTRRD